MTSGQALPAPLPETPSLSPLKLLTGTLEAPGLLEAPASAQPTRRPLGPPRLTHHTHAPCTRGPSPRTRWQQPWRARTHTRLPPLPGPSQTNTACTHTHTLTHARSRGRGGPWGWGLGSAAVAPTPSRRLQAPSRHPENGVVQLGRKLQKNRKLETNPNPLADQPQIHSTSSRPTPNHLVSRGPGRGGGPSPLCFRVAEGAPPRWGGGLEHPLGAGPGLSLLVPLAGTAEASGAPA